MRKLLIGLLIFIIVIVLAGLGALYYIRPERSLDLAYGRVPLNDRALTMAKKLSTELVLTEADIVNLAKKSLADNPQVEDNVRVTGADFDLTGDRLYADLNIIWRERIPATLHITYRLHWEEPNVIATVEQAKLKGIKLPNSMFSDRIIPISGEMPDFLHIASIKWGDDSVSVKFKKPTLSDLRKLIG